MRVGKWVAVLVWLLLAATGAHGVTRTVNPGSTSAINTAISQSSAGDVVLVKSGAYSGGGLNMNRNGATLAIEANTTLNGNNSGQAVSIMCSDCSVIGLTDNWAEFPQFIDYAYGIQADRITGRNNVTISRIIQRNTNYGFWVSGDNWKIEAVEVDRIIRRSSGGDADYARIFGRNHLIRYFYFHGTRIPGDLAPGPDYAHTDCWQFYNQNGEVLHNVRFEYGICTDFVQGFFLGNETGTNSGMSNVTIENLVMWGTNFQAVGNLLGIPSWTYYLGKNGPINGATVNNTTNYNSSNVYGFISRTTGSAARNVYHGRNGAGTVWQLDGTNSPGNIQTPASNYHFRYGWIGQKEASNDVTNVAIQFVNEGNLVGPDGLPFTADDGWRLTNAGIKDTHGAQIPNWGGTTPPPADTTQPTITILGANPMTVAVGQAFTDPGATATDNVDGVVPVTASGTVNTSAVGSYACTYTAKDTAENVAVATRIVHVVAAPNTAPTVTIAPVPPVTLAQGQISASITVTATGVDAEGPVTYQWTNGPAAASWTYLQSASTVRRTVTVRDSGGLTATTFVEVVVNPAPPVEPPAEDFVTQADFDAAIAALNQQIAAMNSTIAALSNRVTAAETTNSQQTQAISGVEATANSAKDTADAAKATADTASATAQSAKASADAAAGKASEVERLLAEIDKWMNAGAAAIP